MCGKKDAQRLVQEAIALESDSPVKARTKYLEAAEIMLLLSTQQEEDEAKCVQLAGNMFQRAEVLKGKKPAPRLKIIERGKSELSFEDVGGLHDLKEEIRLKIIEPLKNPDVFEFFGKKIGGGILMFGPPGCGKSLIAEATANEADASFFNVKASDLKGKYVGETEKNIAELFAKARASAPSIIFFDEFESIGSERSKGHLHEKSMVGQLLAEMDGVGNKDKKILLLAATNEPWSVDLALLRSGRFGSTILVPEPDASARLEIFSVLLKSKPVGDVFLPGLVELTEGFSGAELASVVDRATDFAVKDYFRTKKLRKLTMKDFERAVKETKSFVQPWYGLARKMVHSTGLSDQFGLVNC